MSGKNLQLGVTLVLLVVLGTAWAQTPEPARPKAFPSPPVPLPAPTVEGTVVDDANANGVLDPGEKGIPGVRVSDGVNFVTTDAEGKFKFERLRTAPFVYVEVPAGRYRARRFWQPLKTVPRDETARENVDFLLVRDSRKLPEDAPLVAHVVDVRPSWMPDKVAREHLWTVLRHIRGLQPQPRAVVIVGSLKGCQDRMQLVDSLAEVLPPVYYVFGPTGDEPAGRLAEELFRQRVGPTSYSFGSGDSLCLVSPGLVGFALDGDQVPPQLIRGRKLLFFSETRLMDLSGEQPLVFATAGLHEGTLAGQYRLFWGDGTSRPVWPLEKPLFRWVYPVVGSTVSSPRLRLLATAYDPTDATKGSKHAGEGWRLAQSSGEPGAMKLAEVDLKGRTLTGSIRRTLAKPGPFLDPGLWVCRFSGLAGLGLSDFTVSFEAVSEEGAPGADLSTPWAGPGGNDLHSGSASAAVMPPLKLAGWSQFGSAPMLVMEGKCLVPGDEIARTFRWVEPKAEASTDPAAVSPALFQRERCGSPVMNDDFICWVSESGELVWVPTGEAPQPEVVNASVRRLTLTADALQAGEDLWKGRSPAIVGNAAMVVLPGGEAVAVDLKSGRQLWRQPVDEDCLTPAGTEEGFLLSNVCLSVRSGKPVWKMDRAGFIRSEVSLLGKRFVVTGLVDEKKPGKLTQTAACFQTQTGKESWRVRLAEVDAWDRPRSPGATFGAGRAFVGSAAGILHAIDLEKGEVRWKTQTGASILAPGGTATPSGRITARAVFSEKVVYFAGHDGVVQGCDARSGKKLFSYDLGLPVLEDPVISGNALLVGTCDGLVFWFIPAVPTGREGAAGEQ